MRYVRIPMSRVLLEQLLRLPADMKLVGIASTKSGEGVLGLVDQVAIVKPSIDSLDLVVEHPRFKEVAGIEDAPRAEPTLQKHVARVEWKFGEVSFGDGRSPL